jgi:ketosteroid isomerase-like protein
VELSTIKSEHRETIMSAEPDLAAATNRFLDLLEAGDRAGLAAMLHPDVVWITPMTASGDPADAERTEGTSAFFAHARAIAALNRSARFADRRVTTSADGATTFVQTQGDFRTADGRPYRNVYVFRFDWRDGLIVSWEEYANPITILRTFPDVFSEHIRRLTG